MTGKMITYYVTFYTVCMATSLFAVKYSHLILLYPDVPSKSKRESFSAVILVKVNHKLKTVMLDSLNIHEFLSSRLL